MTQYSIFIHWDVPHRVYVPVLALLRYLRHYLSLESVMPRYISLKEAVRRLTADSDDKHSNSDSEITPNSSGTVEASVRQFTADSDDEHPDSDCEITPNSSASAEAVAPGGDDSSSDGELVIESDSDDSTPSSGQSVSDDDDVRLEVFTAKSGTVWSSQQPPIRLLARNVIDFHHGTTARPPTERAAFELFFSEDIMRIIMRETNRRLRQDYQPLFTYEEITAAIATLIRSGADKDNNASLRNLFEPSDSRPFYRCAISVNLMELFLRYVSLDNKITRRDRQQHDKLAAVRDTWSIFNSNLRKPYVPSETLTVDEQLYGYRGYVPGRSYMPAKPTKYGVKIFWLCDATNGYALNSLLYSGKQEERAVGLAQSVVLELCRPYYGTKRNITVDRYFTSFPLCTALLDNGLTLLGTVVPNRRDVPTQVRDVKQRELYSTKVLYNHQHHVMLLSYVPKKGKNVMMMSSSHQAVSPVPCREDLLPDVIQQYNLTKGGVDVLDSCIEDFTCKRKTSRYPLLFMFNMIDVSLCNAYHIMKLNGYKLSRKSFMKAAAAQLAEANITRRYNSPRVYGQAKDSFLRYGMPAKRVVTDDQGPATGPRKCKIDRCGKSTRKRCMECASPVCKEHEVVTVKCCRC